MPTTRPRFAIWTYDRALFERLKVTAQREGRTPGDVVDDALRRYLSSETSINRIALADKTAALAAAAIKKCPICDEPFTSATQRQIYCSARNRRCMKYAQRYGVEHGRRMYAAKHPPR